jgi:hypothetical protein
MRQHPWLLAALVPVLAVGCNTAGSSSGSRPVTAAEVRAKFDAAWAAGQFLAQTKDEFADELTARRYQMDD